MTVGPLVSLVGITKHFGGVRRLKGVDLAIRSGEVVALVGHNGAGKSVLVQILSGVFPPSSGEIRIDGQPSRFIRPPTRGATRSRRSLPDARARRQSRRAGQLLPRPRAPNPLRLSRQEADGAETARALAALNPNFVEIERPVRQMSGGQRQAIAIARAIHFQVRLLIMDEPTASLGPHETAQVGALIRQLRDQGIGILLVSHDVRDVIRLADRIVVLKNGELVGTAIAAETSEDAVIDMIIRGRKLPIAWRR